MRILILSDIHSNWLALQAIQESFDACLFLGDLVDYGLDPNPCVAWIRQHATYAIRGNHDHGAAQEVYIQGVSGFRYLTGVTRSFTCQNLLEEHRQYLASLPTTQYLTINHKRFLLVHATPRDPFDEYAPAELEFWKRRLEGIDVDYVCVGHTHMPYQLQVGNTTVINPGSVGLPRDGIPLGSYAIVTPDGVELKRFDYPIEEQVSQINASALPDAAKKLLSEVYRTGKLDKKPLPN